MPRAAVFDVDGTLIDSVDLHALSWHEALQRYGHDVSFEAARSQIGKGGDQLLPVFLTEAEREDHGAAIEAWRSERFRSEYLAMVRPFAAVPELLRRVRAAGLRVAAATSSGKDDLERYLDLAGIRDLVDAITTADDAERSKPEPDIFVAALDRLGIAAAEAVAIGDTPYDAQSAGKAGMASIGMLCGGFTEADLRAGGCVAVYPGPAALLACFDASPLGAGPRRRPGPAGG